jgi:hypothetical protein
MFSALKKPFFLINVEKSLISINLTPAEDEKSGKIVNFLQTFGDWTFI